VADALGLVGGCASRCRSEFLPCDDVERTLDLAAVGAPAHEQSPEGKQEVGQPPIVLITWQDAWADSEQHERAEWRSDYLVRTTGFLVRDEPEVMSVAQEILPEEDGFRAVTHIPRGMIASVTALEAPLR